MIPEDKTEVIVSPFIFEYDEDRHEMYVAKGEETLAMCEHIQPYEWIMFVSELEK